MIKVCVISCGMIANSAHIPAYEHFCDEFDIVAVCDINGENAKNTAERHNIKKWYTDARIMLEECRPDLVSVCVPNCFHKEYTMLALEYGANVLCEKPLAFTKQDALEMFDKAKEKGKTLMACQSMRFTPDRLAAKAYIEKHGETDFYYAELSRIRRRGIPYWGKFHMKKISGGGAFVDIGVHMLDCALWLMGNTKVSSVCGVMSKHHANEIGDLAASGALTGYVDSARKFDPCEMDVEDFSSGIIKFENGAVISFKVAWATNMPEESSIKLINKNVGISLPSMEVLSGADGREMLVPVDTVYDSKFPGHFHLVKNMGEVINHRAEPMVKPEESIACAEIIEAFYKSAESGKEVFI